MRTVEFTLILSDQPLMTDELFDRLYEAGCDDGTPAISNGIQLVMFHREAESLEHAIQTAIDNVSSVGFQIKRIESDESVTIDRFNNQLAQV